MELWSVGTLLSSSCNELKNITRIPSHHTDLTCGGQIHQAATISSRRCACQHIVKIEPVSPVKLARQVFDLNERTPPAALAARCRRRTWQA